MRSLKYSLSLTQRIDRHTLNAALRLWAELLALVRAQVPDVHDAAVVADDQVLLVGVQRHRVDGSVGLEDLLAPFSLWWSIRFRHVFDRSTRVDRNGDRFGVSITWL